MTDKMLFINAQIAAYPEDSPDPFASRLADYMVPSEHYGIAQFRVESVALNIGSSRIITPLLPVGLQWTMVMLRVKGTVRLDVVGQNFANSASISGSMVCSGTAVYPGVLILSSANTTSLSLVGLANSTVVEVFAGVSGEDA